MNTNEFLANLAILGLRTGSMAHRDHRIPLTEIIVLALLYKSKSLTSEDALVTIERVTDAIGSSSNTCVIRFPIVVRQSVRKRFAE